MADAEHLAILDLGVQAWNDWRLQAGAQRPDLSGADLRQRRLGGIDLRRADLSDSDLSGAYLCRADLGDATLEETNFTGAALFDACLDGAVTSGANFAGAWLGVEGPGSLPLNRKQLMAAFLTSEQLSTGQPELVALLRQGASAWNAWRRQQPEFMSLNLRGAGLAGASLSGAALNGVDLSYADLTGADLVDAKLLAARLRGATLDAARLCGADLFAADLSGASLLGADLGAAILNDAVCHQTDFRAARLHRAQLRGARLEGAYFFQGCRAHLRRFKQGALAWNEWRQQHPEVMPDLSGANLCGWNLGSADMSGARLTDVQLVEATLNNGRFAGADLRGANLNAAVHHGADFSNADLEGAHLEGAVSSGANFAAANLSFGNLSNSQLSKAVFDGARLTSADLERAQLGAAQLDGADLSGANLLEARLENSRLRKACLRGAALWYAVLHSADLEGADLSGANLISANLHFANLRDACLTGADLQCATMVKTVMDGVSMAGCAVYGVAAWGLDLGRVKDQSNLQITPHGEPTITVDNLEVAQFIYLMLNNRKIRDVLDTVTGKGVLILGRFSEERKAVLDGIRDRLREHNFVPMVFDWDQSAARDLTETVQLLANLSRFVVADLTDAKSIPQELMSIVPHMPSLPVRPIVLSSQLEYAMFEHFKPYPWMLPVYPYDNREQLLQNLTEAIIAPVLAWEADRQAQPGLEAQLRAQQEEIARLRAALGAKESLQP